MAKRGPKPQFEQNDLLNTALEIVTREGFSALSMSSLARHLGTSVSALYRYVENREALFALLQIGAIDQYRSGLKDRLEQIEVHLTPSRQPKRIKALTRVCGAYTYYLHFPKIHPSSYRLLDAVVSAPDLLLDDMRAREVDVALKGLIAMCIETLKVAEREDALSAGDAMQRTHIIWAAFHGLSHFSKRDRIQPAELQVPQLSRSLLTTLLIGFGAKPADLDKAWDLLED